MTPLAQRRADALGSRPILARIADSLRLPVSAFGSDVTEPSEPSEAVTGVADIVAAFVAIEDAAARRTCLAFVRAMSRS